MPYIKFRLRT